jgi:RimJ/RimL family protein N-acetyltransferase
MPKRFIQPFETWQIGLRLLTSDDLQTTLAWRNQDRVRKSLITSRRLTPEEHRSWYETYASKDDDFVFLFSDVQDLSHPVGQVSLYRIDWTRRTAEFGRLMIGEEHALHKGLAIAATRAIINLAFTCFRLETLSLKVYESNAAAMAIYKKVGFTTTSVQGGLVRMELHAEQYFRPNRSFS